MEWVKSFTGGGGGGNNNNNNNNNLHSDSFSNQQANNNNNNFHSNSFSNQQANNNNNNFGGGGGHSDSFHSQQEDHRLSSQTYYGDSFSESPSQGLVYHHPVHHHRPVYVAPPQPPPPKYPHRGYHPGLPDHLRDECYGNPYTAWGYPNSKYSRGPPIEPPGRHAMEYTLPDAWYMYPTGPTRCWWTGHVPNRQDRLWMGDPRSDETNVISTSRVNNGVAMNEQAMVSNDAIGREFVPHDWSIRNSRWQHRGSMLPDGQVHDAEGKKRHLAMYIKQYPGMAQAVDIKGLEEKRFDYKKMQGFRNNPTLFPDQLAKEREVEVFDDEALAEFFADPEAMLEREVNVY